MSSGRINNLLLGSQVVDRLAQMNILLIGVGGIGCEVLKVITKYNFKSLHILDLDTIEVSNLNRQFLFRKEHRGMYKAHVAKERILSDYPGMNIVSYNENIKDEKYGVKFFKQFQLVIMALDNRETRSFVNQICMTLDIPVLDAGTTGYKGQAFLLRKGVTRCYDCFPTDTAQKVYPACTIRTLPEKPVHCVIWAKYLFGVLFGPSDDESNMLVDLREQLVQQENDQNDKMGLVVAEEIFSKAIKRQIETNEDEEISEKFKHVKPLDFQAGEFANLEHKNQYLNNDLAFLKNTHSIKDYIEIFRDSYLHLFKQKQKDDIVQFEKDDPFIIKFVTAACNLRCFIFNIPLQNEFQVKQISGNIIPAIASTNALVAAIEISETIKFLASQVHNTQIKHKELYVQNDKSNKVLAANIEKPNQNCQVCQPNILPDIVYCNFENTTFGEFLQKVVLSETQLNDFSVSRNANLIYEQNEFIEEDPDDLEQNKIKENKKLSDFFGNLGDTKLNVSNEETEKLFRLYIVVHVPTQEGFEIYRQLEFSQRKEVDMNSILKDQGVNMKGQEEIEEEKRQFEKKVKKLEGGGLEILDSDDEVEIGGLDQEKSLKRNFENVTVDSEEKNGQDPQKKVKANNNEDEDSEIEIL